MFGDSPMLVLTASLNAIKRPGNKLSQFLWSATTSIFLGSGIAVAHFVNKFITVKQYLLPLTLLTLGPHRSIQTKSYDPKVSIILKPASSILLW